VSGRERIAVLWRAFNLEVAALRSAFAEVPDDVSLLAGVNPPAYLDSALTGLATGFDPGTGAP